MYLNKLSLNNFKNYEGVLFNLSPKVNVFTGMNGAGKTNILDAIYYLSFCKSYFNIIDSQNILHGCEYFMVNGEYINNLDSIDTVTCSFKLNDRKHFKLNKKEYDRLADHIGLIPLVIITPSDSNLVYGGSEDRRKYVDGVISQFDKSYLDTLIDYGKVVQHRNAFLKILSDDPRADITQLDIWDAKMSSLGTRIFDKRKEFLEEFIPLVGEYYSFISGGKELIDLEYESSLKEGSFEQKLSDNRRKDLLLKYSSVGVHRDDLIFKIDGYPVKKFGSQGQQKSFLVALKLAQFMFTKSKKGYKPLLLLDDVFDKLDILRIQQLMKLVSKNEFGQIFITDTSLDRVAKIFEEINVDIKYFEIENGHVLNDE